MNLLTRRQLLISANMNRYVQPQVKIQPQKLPPMAMHSIILGNLVQEFIDLHPNKTKWSYNQKCYLIKLLESYDLAVSQIEDIELKELFTSLMEIPPVISDVNDA